MKIRFTVIGKTSQDFIQKGIDEYCDRLKHYFPFELNVIPDIKNAKNLSFAQIKEKEGEILLKSVVPEDFIVLLDEKGREFSSLKFADFLEKLKNSSSKRIIFVIGGAYGFSEKVYERANEKISLSKMTFSHQIVRLIFVEQLYRAATILNGEPYHHE
ncbi:MAG: 23S rRNA (pseudouridine(1915)-N(3))-methyltransferase RlmH [Dysgonamonadaceae bacterium]|jgi:23S rRNA (pseudouridine1915-N3)-methyltransferase|nr:23S rRNA (pseudouridine(1915)-N(3))-methyltransferase RlmH [Dysgonamonadaceae bacterium]